MTDEAMIQLKRVTLDYGGDEVVREVDLTLHRGETKVIPESLREEIPLKPLAKNIKALTFKMWTGDRWDPDRWDTDSADWRNHLPHMVMIEIEGWEKELSGEDNAVEAGTAKLNTVVFIEQAYNFKELKDRSKTVKWY